MKVMRRILLFVLLLVPFAAPGQAAPISIGILHFNVLYESVDGAPGINAFTIANLTGDPGMWGFEVADFPVSTSLTFTSLAFGINGTSPADVDPLEPGVHAESLPDAFRFLDSVPISSATLSGSISAGLFTLSDGTQWVAGPTLFSATLNPSEGSDFLTAGLSALITVEATLQAEPPPAPVPEPGTLLLLGTGIAALAARKRRRT